MNTKGIAGQTFTQDERVMVRRLGDGQEYRATIAGIAVDSPVKIMIVKIIDRFRNEEDYNFTHCAMPEVCIDKEEWDE